MTNELDYSKLTPEQADVVAQLSDGSTYEWHNIRSRIGKRGVDVPRWLHKKGWIELKYTGYDGYLKYYVITPAGRAAYEATAAEASAGHPHDAPTLRTDELTELARLDGLVADLTADLADARRQLAEARAGDAPDDYRMWFHESSNHSRTRAELVEAEQEYEALLSENKQLRRQLAEAQGALSWICVEAANELDHERTGDKFRMASVLRNIWSEGKKALTERESKGE